MILRSKLNYFFLLQRQRSVTSNLCLSCSRLCAEHYTCLSASKRALVTKNTPGEEEIVQAEENLLFSPLTEAEVHRKQTFLKPHMQGFLLTQNKVLRRLFFVPSFCSVRVFCQIHRFVLKLSNERCNEP